ncbi:DUF1134 domain-containing protein [Sphingomonas sp.]|uniref:DUF1134 domain-containing protein n=1 Tax=Sphingomonas sp. TaxID=28214 RepID=UPI0025FB3E95|nr:DUF1134 domain-containing protein [Sphingomonas sp.]
MARSTFRRVAASLAGLALAGAAPAQMRTVDPNSAIDRDLAPAPARAPQSPAPAYGDPVPAEPVAPAPINSAPPATPAAPAPNGIVADRATAAGDTYKRKDLIAAGEDVFGRGAQGFAGLIEKILKEQGEPNAYIAGREASGAFVVGLRYGSGVMSHRVEGDRPVYWTGPSIGFDAGGNASKVFVLVYNLYDSQEIYRRYPEGEGHLYFVGGFSATYLRRGNIVLIPIRLGVGARAGVNVGYMKFSEKAKWLPF